MGTLYENIMALCNAKGIRGGKLCTDVGISKGLLTDLKMGRRSGVSAVTAQKIAAYFDVSVGFLLGEESEIAPANSSERNLDDIKAAFFEGYGDNLSEEEKDELWEDARMYAKYKAQQKK